MWLHMHPTLLSFTKARMHDEHIVAMFERKVAASCMQAVVLQELARDATASASEVQAAVKGACALALLAAAAQGPNAFMIQSPSTAVFTTEDMKKGSVWLPRAAGISVILNEARDGPSCMSFKLAASHEQCHSSCMVCEMHLQWLKPPLQCTLFPRSSDAASMSPAIVMRDHLS